MPENQTQIFMEESKLLMEDSFAKIDVISRNFFQDLKNNFLLFPQDEDGVSQPTAKSMKK